ncbi:unnamed protein product [Rotaria sp. Silwood1]|nr:unnamed protein product [Rotaria sp. Silwood1]CAF1596389.1 unnamed protein product [Rotaria sp. Silwood1]
MHKSYRSTCPATNKFLKKRWDDKYYSDHRILVRDAQPCVDARPPQTFLHLHMKYKKFQLEEEHRAIIERDNRILLEKVSHIMKTKGSVDSHHQYELKSLNQGKRRQELLKVSKENANIMKRLMQQKLDINRENWKDNWAKNSVYFDNIAKYDIDWFISKSTDRQLNNEKSLLKRSQSVPREDKKVVKDPLNRNDNEEKTNVENNDLL